MTDERSAIRDAIKEVLLTVQSQGKTADRILKPAIARELTKRGFGADQEDTRGMLEQGLPVWRSKDSQAIEISSGRRRVDVVVYSKNAGGLIGLIETESDLKDLRPSGAINKRSGHYDVYSIASQENRRWFESYKSLERMAASAYYHYRRDLVGREITNDQLVAELEKLSSNESRVHNPASLPIFVMSAECRMADLEMLDARCRSLQAEILFQRISGRVPSFAGSFFESRIEAF